MSKGIEIPSCKCERCGYTWYLRYPRKPRVCPSCKSPYWQASSEFVNDLKADSERANKIMDRLTKKIDEAEKKPSNWSSIIKEGWQRMLETSELPIASVDRIFAGGFSVYDWFMNAGKISEGLARSVVNYFTGTDKAAETIGDNVVQRAEEVLDWKKIICALDQDSVKVLALVWLADKLSSEVMLPETEVNIQRNVWQLLERNLGKKKVDLISQVERVIEIIDSENKGVTSWAEVIRFA